VFKPLARIAVVKIPSTPGMIWTRPAPAGGFLRPTLTRDKVLRAALAILDAEGVAGLSMRRLGATLDVAATTLYWHVRTKDELLDLAFDEVMAELADPAEDTGGDWRAAVRAAVTDLRSMMLRHRWYPALFSTRPSIGPHSLRFWAGLLEVFRRAGFTGADLDHAYCMVSDYVIGTTAIHVSYDEWARSDPADVTATRAYVAEAARVYPAYADYVHGYIARTEPAQRRDERYEFALECMLDGLETRLSNASRIAGRVPKTRRKAASRTRR
jgi:AcrR family transcriptional regulator